MDINTLLVGAAISLVSSIAILAITEYFQYKRQSRTRKNQVISERLDKIENGIKSVMHIIDRLRYEGISILEKYPKNDNDEYNINDHGDFIKKTFDEISLVSPLLLGSDILRNDKVDKLMGRLINHEIQLFNLFSQLGLQTSEEFTTTLEKIIGEKLISKLDDGMDFFAKVYSVNQENWTQSIKEFEEKASEISILAREDYINLVYELDKMRMEL